jgi:DNA adenine methylase|tara:strand:+ start:6560 stop:7414 length:855 start_codon:yes stop_codon:yes gene_type:complete
MKQALPTINDRSPSLIDGVAGVTPIFRWAGSKKRLLKELRLASPSVYRRYHEPFLGSGVFFLQQNKGHAVLSDYNPHLIQAYEQVRKNPLKLWERCVSIPEDTDTYYEVRAVNPLELDDLERAARFIYLNRYCFNGVYRTNLQGGFNVSRGQGNLGIPTWKVFKAFSDRLQDSQLLCQDFEVTMSSAIRNDFIYLDPPYIDLSKRDRGEYGTGSFGYSDLERLADASHRAAKLGVKVLISYRDCETIKALFPDWRLFPLEVSRSVSCNTSKRSKAKEIFLTSYI